MAIPRGFNAVVQKKLDIQTHTLAALHGRKFTPQQAVILKMVDWIVPKENLMKEAKKLADTLKDKGSHRAALKQIKSAYHYDTIEKCNYRAVDPDSASFMVPKF